MRLLLAGNDITVIALWLGHEQIATTNIYQVCRELHQTGEPNKELRGLAA